MSRSVGPTQAVAAVTVYGYGRAHSRFYGYGYGALEALRLRLRPRGRPRGRGYRQPPAAGRRWGIGGGCRGAQPPAKKILPIRWAKRSNFELYGYGCEPPGFTATASRRRPIYGYGWQFQLLYGYARALP